MTSYHCALTLNIYVIRLLELVAQKYLTEWKHKQRFSLRFSSAVLPTALHSCLVVLTKLQSSSSRNSISKNPEGSARSLPTAWWKGDTISFSHWWSDEASHSLGGGLLLTRAPSRVGVTFRSNHKPVDSPLSCTAPASLELAPNAYLWQKILKLEISWGTSLM